MAWDFTDSSYRPSIELKATPSKITSMEFLIGQASSKHQLLAIGVDIGTLHIYELPRNLVRPIPNEEQTMERFLQGEMDTMDFLKEFTPTEEVDIDSMHLTRPGTAMSADNDELPSEPVDLDKIRKEQEQKELDEFDKLEAAFVAELGLGMEDVPDFAKKHVEAALAAATE